ncbi:lipocalin family protein [Psychromonas sp.]|uniref:lipocalin family protein n=1 Tax=Psychromonas sp. TaxID=1884585 RepID=UPI0039E36CBC
MKKIVICLTILLLSGCLGMPKKVTPVSDFELPKYLGTWYEIARLDHSFERGLEQVSAQYKLNEDGDITVINRGFSTQKNSWSEAVGKARLVSKADQGYFKVSFFGPFYASYIIFELDKDNYQYAFVCGPSLSYLWLLSRKKEVDPQILARFIEQSKELGFDTSELIFVEQGH